MPERECVFIRGPWLRAVFIFWWPDSRQLILFLFQPLRINKWSRSPICQCERRTIREMLSLGSSIKFHALGIFGPVSVFNGDGCWVAAHSLYLYGASLSIPHISLDASDWWGWALAPCTIRPNKLRVCSLLSICHFWNDLHVCLMGVSWVLIIFEHFMLAHWESGVFLSLLRCGFDFMIPSALSTSNAWCISFERCS